MSTITYEAVRTAKENISKLMDSGIFQDAFDKEMNSSNTSEWELIRHAKVALIHVLDNLSVEERTVVMYGGFVYDIRHGTINFSMPATKDVVGKELIDSEERHDCVRFILDVSTIDATDAGFYGEEISITVDTGRF